MRWIKQSLYLLVGLLLLATGLSKGNLLLVDLRPDYLKTNGVTEVNTFKGKKILFNAIEKLGGFDHWGAITTIEIIYTNQWRGWGSPWPENPQTLSHRMISRTFNSQVEFLSGKKEGEIWGIQSWKTYKIKDKDLIVKPNENTLFYLSAYQYFIELNYRLLTESAVIAYAGEKKFNQQKYLLIFCSWKDGSPNKSYDQYLAYINQSTGLLEACEFTLRDSFLSIGQGAILFSNFNSVNQLKIPLNMKIYSGRQSIKKALTGPEKNRNKYLHQINIGKVTIDQLKMKTLSPIDDLSLINNKP